MKSLRRVAACLIVWASLAGTIAANQFGDISVTVDQQPVGDRTHGYTEYRFIVTNSSPSEQHQVRLVLPENSYSGSWIQEVTRSAVLDPSSTVSLSLFTPLPLSGNGLGVEIDGQRQRDHVAVTLTQFGYAQLARVLVSRGAAGLGFPTWAGSVLKDAEGKPLFTTVLADQLVSQWSDNWLGYSSYDGIALTAEELSGMPPEIRTALLSYAECGGSLFVAGPWELPEAWRRFTTHTGSLTNGYAAFGQIQIAKSVDLKSLTKSDWDEIQKSWKQSGQPWSTPVYDPGYLNRSLPVTENVSVPVRGLFLLMLLFVVAIGPINLIVLSRRKRKMWLLWTVPVVSLMTCLAISAYAIWSEGWKARSRAVGVTVLDETTHRASTIGCIGFYAPLTPGGGLHFSYDTEVSLRGFSPYYYYGAGQGGYRTIDWSNDQHLASGWVSARTPSHFLIRRSEQRRERMVLRRDGGTLSVVNGLGVTVRNLWIADRDGVVYTAQNIAPGAIAVLLAQPPIYTAYSPDRLREIYVSDWASAPFSMGSDTPRLRPLTYVASLDDCPFIEQALPITDSSGREALVYGIMKESPDEN